jgi:carnitine-CoA ligase
MGATPCRINRLRVLTLATADALRGAPFLGQLGRHAKVPLVAVDGSVPGAVPLDDLVASGRPVRSRRRNPGDPALAMTTSGTTGQVKAALLPVAAGPAQAARVQRAMRYDTADVLYNFFPWYHINARHAAFLPAVLSGARLVVDRRFSASRFIDIVRAEGVTAFNFMGAVCAMLLRQPPSAHDRSHQVRRAYGGPAPAALVQAVRERFGVTLLQAYACTELGDVSTTQVADVRPGAAGRPVPEYRLRVVDASGHDVAPGQVGELLVRPERPHLSRSPGTSGIRKQPREPGGTVGSGPVTGCGWTRDGCTWKVAAPMSSGGAA